MFFSKKNKRKKRIKSLINKLNLPRTIFFGEGKWAIYSDTEVFFRFLLSSNDKSIVADSASNMLLTTFKKKNDLREVYLKLFSSGEIYLCNNNLHYLGEKNPEIYHPDILAYFLDFFTEKYRNLAELSVVDILNYVENGIDFDEIRKHKIPEKYYTKELIKNRFNSVIGTWKRFADYTGFDVIFDEKNEDVDINISFYENIERYIVNYNELKNHVNNYNYEIKREKNSDIELYNFKGCFDFKSVTLNGFFMDLGLKNDFLMSELILFEDSKNPIIFFSVYEQGQENIIDQRNVEDTMSKYRV